MNLPALRQALKKTTVTADDAHDLVALAALSHNVVANAIHLWEQSAPDDAKGLLTLSQGWRWDRATQRYETGTGRVVTDAELKELAEAVADALKKKSKLRLLLLLAGGLTLFSWRHDAANDLAALYLLMGALGSGGIEGVTPATKRLITGHPDRPPGLLYTLNRLKVFARKLEVAQDDHRASEAMGLPVTAPVGPLEQRMSMYIDSARPIFEEARRQSHEDEAKRTGKRLEEKNVLGDADHCTTTNGVVGCPEWSKRGWLPAGTMTAPGERPCIQNCKCRMVFRMISQ